MSYRLLACDIDNTLVRFPDPPSPRVVAAIQRAVQAGVTVVLVTGRAFRRAQPVAAAFGVETPIICNHGGSIRDSQSGAILRRQTLPRPQLRQIVAWLQGQDVRLLLFDGDQIYHDCTTEQVIDDFAIYTHGPGTVFAADLLQVLPGQAEIVLATSLSHDYLAQVHARAERCFGATTRVLFSHPHGLDIMPPSSKSQALAWLAGQMDIGPDEVMAIGDGDNDVDMLAWAGLGVAIEDGHPDALAAADVIAPSFEQEGLVWAMERFLFSPPYSHSHV